MQSMSDDRVPKRRRCAPNLLLWSTTALILLAGGRFDSKSTVAAFTTPHAPSSRTIRLQTPTTPTLLFSKSPQRQPIVDAEIVQDHRDTPSSKQTKKSTDPTPVAVSALQQWMTDSSNPWVTPTTAFSAAALALVLLLSPLSANAAMSGGRMGGSFPSQRQSITRPSPGGSFGQGYSQGFRSGYGSGYGSGYYSRPGITVAPYISPFGGGISPFFSPFPRPFFYGSPGVITYSRGPSFFDLVLLGGIGFIIFNAIRSASAGVNFSDVASTWADNVATSALGSGTSVVQISVALDVPNRDDPNSILSVLNRLSQTARTDSRVGIQNLTSQVALELLRRKSSILSAATRYKHFNDRNKAQRDFNSLSVQERGKFEQETVSKYGGVDYSQGASSRRSATDMVDTKATVAVVTIMLAIDGDSTKVPQINSIQDVEEALRKIASDAKIDSCLQTAEILWTPEDRTETLTLREVIADYPKLRSV